MPFISIWPIDRALLSANTPGQSGPGSDGNEGVLHIPGMSSSDCLVPYPGHLLGVSYPPTKVHSVYNTASADWVISVWVRLIGEIDVLKSVVLERNNWNQITVCKLFVSVVTWSHNCSLRIIVSYLKPYNWLQISCVRWEYIKPYCYLQSLA